jgi:hypothetical protein
MNAGKVDCTVPMCTLGDIAFYLSVEDSSMLHFFGGTTRGLELVNLSTAHFYGTGLELAIEGTSGIHFHIEDVLSSGEPIDLSFLKSPSANVVVHNIPEPATFAIIVWCVVVAYPVYCILRRQGRWP